MRHPADTFGMDPYSPAVSAILRVLEGFDPGEERSLGDLAVDIDAAARPIIEAEALSRAADDCITEPGSPQIRQVKTWLQHRAARAAEPEQ